MGRRADVAAAAWTAQAVPLADPDLRLSRLTVSIWTGPTRRRRHQRLRRPGLSREMNPGAGDAAMRPAPTSRRRARDAFEIFDDGIHGAVDALVKEGRVDPNGWHHRLQRHGLSGAESRHLRATFPFVPRRWPMATPTPCFASPSPMACRHDVGTAEALNEGVPFGSRAGRVGRNDPALHTECIRAATRIESYGPTVMNQLGVYALIGVSTSRPRWLCSRAESHAVDTRRSHGLVARQRGLVRVLVGRQDANGPLFASETAESLAAQYATMEADGGR